MKVFISHIHEESPIAKVLKEWIETTFSGNVVVFVSSDIRDLPAGKRWLNEIDSSLSSCSVFIMLCSPASVTRPWINFEAGCAWIKKVPLMPVCHSGIRKHELLSPISEFQAVEIDEKTFVDDFFESLRIHFKMSKLPRIDGEAMRKELKEALDSVEVRKVEPQRLVTGRVDQISDEDALNILESWMGKRPASNNTNVMRYSDVDAELELPEGTSKRLIETAAQRWNYVTVRRGDDTILFKDGPDKFRRKSWLDDLGY